jgi:hypothetical protein
VSASLSYSAEGFDDVGSSRRVGDSGDVEITGVPPGLYTMRFSVNEPGKPFDGTLDFFGHQGCGGSIPLSVGRDEVADIRVVEPGCSEITGQIMFEGDKKPLLRGSDCVAFDDGSHGRVAMLKPDGSFRILGLFLLELNLFDPPARRLSVLPFLRKTGLP